nr:MAG: hypothetical protein [Dicistroviridae sp.]
MRSFRFEGAGNVQMTTQTSSWFHALVYDRRGSVGGFFCSNEQEAMWLDDDYYNRFKSHSAAKLALRLRMQKERARFNQKQAKLAAKLPFPEIDSLKEIKIYRDGLRFAKECDIARKLAAKNFAKAGQCKGTQQCLVPATCSGCGRCVHHCMMSERKYKCDTPLAEYQKVYELYHPSVQTVRQRKALHSLRSKGSLGAFYKRNSCARKAALEVTASGKAHAGFFNILPEKFDLSVHLPFLDKLAESLSVKVEDVPWRKIFTDFAFLVATIAAANGKRAVAAVAVTQFIYNLSVSHDIVTWLLAKVVSMFSSTPNAQAPAAEGLLVPILTLFGVIVTVLGIKAIPSDKSVTEFILRLSKIGACIKSLEVIKDYVTPAIEVTLDYIRVHIFGYSSQMMDAWKSYDDFCEEVKTLNNTGFEERLKTEKALVIQIDDLLLRGSNLMKDLDNMRVELKQRTRFTSCMAWLTRMRTEAANCSAGKHIPRVPPTIFHFVGATGVGKSEATSLLNARLLTSLGHTDPADLHTKVYYRDAGQERFDGYNNGIVGVVMDDFGSRKDSEANPSSEFLETIRMQNSAVWSLPMASLSEKGSVFFRAQYVIWTSNRAAFQIKSLTNPEAILRRVTLKFVQKPHPDFAKTIKIGNEEIQTLDYVKVNRGSILDENIYDKVWLFDMIDPTTDPRPSDDTGSGAHNIIRANMTFDEVATLCESTLAANRYRGEAKLAHTDRYFQRCVQQRANTLPGDVPAAPTVVTGDAHGLGWWFFNPPTIQRDDRDGPATSAETAADAAAHLLGGVHNQGRPFHIRTGPVLESETLAGVDISSDTEKYTPAYPNSLIHEGEDQGKDWGDWTDLKHADCVAIKGSPKVQQRLMRAFILAHWHIELYRRVEGGSDMEQENKIFNSIMFASETPRNFISRCTYSDHQVGDWWKKYYKFCERVERAKETVWDYTPECWKPVLNSFYEGVVLGVKLFIGLVLGSVIITSLSWLIGADTPEQAAWRQQLREAETMRDMLRDPPIELELLIHSLKTKLKIPHEPQFSAESILRNVGRDAESAQERILQETFPESYQDRTPGVRARNVESFQEKTAGVARRNVESHQDKTNAVRPANVEATSDVNAKEVEAKIKRNIYGIESQLSDGSWVFLGSLTFICGRVAITNRHIVRLMADRPIRLFNILHSKKMIILNKENVENLNVSTLEDSIHDRKDLCMIEMPAQVLMHADITKYFMTKADFCQFTSFDEVGVVGYGADLALQQRYSNKCSAVDKVAFSLVEGDGTTTKIRDWYRYGVHSYPGDCGSIAIAFDKSVNRKICGVHMAGYDSEGYHGVAVAVHQELLKLLKDRLTLRREDSLINGIFEGEGSPTSESFGDFVAYGTAAAKTGSVVSVIKKSPVHGVIANPITKPAYLRPFTKEGVLVDPLEKARAKADTVNVPVDEKILQQCMLHYSTLLEDLKQSDEDARVLTWEEAISGVVGNDLYTAVKRNTSPGYGWEDRTGKGKETWLGKDDNYIYDHPDVIAKRDQIMGRLLEGKRASTVFVDTLKDERRPIAKVDEGKTRLFSAGEMVFSLIFRQYFMGFNAHVMRNCIAAESTVGINPFGMQWTMLAERQREMGPHVVAGDFANYDGTLSAAILWSCYDVVERFYTNSTPEDRMIRRGLWCELVNSVHFTVPFDGSKQGSQGFLYQWSHSQPSGNPMTVILNSVYHSVAVRYVYKLCARKYCPEKVALRDFDRYVRHNNYGDDDLFNISSEIIDWFNQLTLTENFHQIGMTYTDEAKTGELVKSRRLEDVAFLKRRFEWDPSQARWRCPHQLEVITEMPMWIKRSACKYELTAETLEEAAHELAQHRREIFDLYLPKLEEARQIVAKRWPCTFGTYDEYQEVEMARIGQFSKPCDRDQRQIAEIPLMTAAVALASGVSHAQESGRESFSALEDDVCPSKTIGYRPGTSRSGISGPAHSTLNSSLASTNQDMSQLQTETVEIVEEQQIVTFHEEGEVNREHDVQAESTRVFRRLDDLGDTRANSVVDFLERPVHAFDFTWKATEPDAVQLLKVQLPGDWIMRQMIREKLAGFKYLKCDFRVRVQVNAQPFNAGLLMLVYIPLEQQLTVTPSSMASFAGLTGYRHVNLDLSQDTAVEITVPFHGTVANFDLLKGYGTMGALKLMVYSPLTGSDDVDGTVWITAENVEVSLPTGLAQIQTSGPAHAGEPAAKKTARDQIQKVKLAEEKGIVSTVANAVSKVAGALTTVPAIGVVANAVQWAAGAVGSVASWFGFSKPMDERLSMKVVPFVADRFANYDGDSKVKSLAFSWANEIAMPTDVFGTQEDEMCFRHILSKPNYVDRFKFLSANKQGSVIWKWPVDPLSCRKLTRNDPSVTPYYPGKYYAENNYVSLHGQCFKFYRGALKYNFKIVKTIYHSGRIRVIVVPGATPDTDVTTIDLNKVHSAIYDIRETNEFDIEVPYKWNTPWKALDGDFGPPLPGKEITPNEPTAMIYIYVVNALRNPATTADHIEFIVEQSAGDDLQFACPLVRREISLISSEEQLRADYPAQPVKLSAEGPAHSGVQQMLDSKRVDFSDANTMTIGEVVTGWRPLLKRYSKWLVQDPVGAGFQVLPYQTANQFSTKSAFDLYAIAESLFRFVSGGLRVASVASGSAGFVTEHSLQAHDTHDARDLTSAYVIQSNLLEPVVEIGVPFYQETPAIPTHVGLPKVSNARLTGTGYTQLPYNEGVAIKSTHQGQLWRSTAEDFSFGYLIGATATLVEHGSEPQVPCEIGWLNDLTIWRNTVRGVLLSGTATPLRRKGADGAKAETASLINRVFMSKPAPASAALITEHFNTWVENVYMPASAGDINNLVSTIVPEYYALYFNEFEKICLAP